MEEKKQEDINSFECTEASTSKVGEQIATDENERIQQEEKKLEEKKPKDINPLNAQKHPLVKWVNKLQLTKKKEFNKKKKIGREKNRR